MTSCEVVNQQSWFKFHIPNPNKSDSVSKFQRKTWAVQTQTGYMHIYVYLLGKNYFIIKFLNKTK